MHVGYNFFCVCSVSGSYWLLFSVLTTKEIFHLHYWLFCTVRSASGSEKLLAQANYFTICLLIDGLTDAKVIGYALKTRSNDPCIASLSLKKSIGITLLKIATLLLPNSSKISTELRFEHKKIKCCIWSQVNNRLEIWRWRGLLIPLCPIYFPFSRKAKHRDFLIFPHHKLGKSPLSLLLTMQIPCNALSTSMKVGKCLTMAS